MSMISDSARSDIENWVDKYPAEEKQSAVMAALRIVQDENSGSLTTELMNEVATLLDARDSGLRGGNILLDV